MRGIFAFTLLVLLAGTSAWGQQTPTAVPGQAGPTAPDTKTPEGARQAESRREAPSAGIRGAGENQRFIEVKVGTNYTAIDPDLRGPDGRPVRSFLTPGSNTTADFTYFQDQAFGGSNRVQVLSIFRDNNDPRVDPESNSFQRGYVRLTTPHWEWNFGDYLVNYSRFTYNQNIKGVHVIRKFDSGFRLMANGGVFTDRWGSVFKDDLPGKPFTRVVAGLRAEQRFAGNNTIGVNFSHGRDLGDSIRRDLLGFGFISVDNQIVSLDTRLNFFKALSLDGEIAYSQTNPDTRFFKEKRKDYGARLDSSLRGGPFFLRTSYTRLMPSFLSINARQLADLQDGSVRGGFDLGRRVTAEASYRITSNDLRNERDEGSTVFRVPEVRFSFRQVPWMGRTIFEIGYRQRQQDGPFRTAFNAREDRTTRIPFAEMSLPISATLFSLSYEHRSNLDHRQPNETSSTNRYAASLRSIFNVGGWQFSPLLRYEIEHEGFFRVLGKNNNRTIQAAMLLEAPKYFTFEFLYRQIGATLFSECLTTPTDFCRQLVQLPPNSTVLLPTGFGRPAYRGAITYKLLNSEDRFIVFSFDHNNNFFALPGRNFRDRVIAVTLVFRFKR